MKAATLRKELQGFIDAMPEQNLYTLRPLLIELLKPQAVIEPANDEECAMIDDAMNEYEEDPSCFTDWEIAKKEFLKPVIEPASPELRAD